MTPASYCLRPRHPRRIGLLTLSITLFLAIFRSVGAEDELWIESFDGAPAQPTPWMSEEWDIQYHTRASSYWERPESMEQQHGGSCDAPPMTHPASSWPGTVYQCRDHIMTAINATDYGLIYLTPNRLADWSSGPVEIQWEMSTENRSGRDWPDLIVSPWEENQATPLISTLSDGVDLQGPPRRAIHVGMDNGQGAPLLGVTRNGSNQVYGSGETTPALNSGVAVGTNEAATRQSFRLTLTNISARFERLQSPTASAVVYWEHSFDDIGYTQGVVQLGHHSYTPWKDGNGGPQTWHWDNVTINPSVPFTMIKADTRYVRNENQIVTFASPAPVGSYLRFNSTHTPQVSIDGGAFVNANRQWEAQNRAEGSSSYWHPIPEGAQSIRVRHTAREWYDLGWPPIAKDFSVWSLTIAPQQNNDEAGAEPAEALAVEPENTPVESPPRASPNDGALAESDSASMLMAGASVVGFATIVLGVVWWLRRRRFV